jgi:hypothetical protein
LLSGIGNGHNHRVVVIPAWVWRGGPVFRAVGVGLAVGVFFGALGFAESGSVAALVALVALGPFVFGIPVARRMARFWPGAKVLSGEDRAAVVQATRGSAGVGWWLVNVNSGVVFRCFRAASARSTHPKGLTRARRVRG